MGVGVDAVRGRDPFADGDDRSPLAENGAKLSVLGEAFAESVEPLGDSLARRARQRLRADVGLDAWRDALIGQELHQRRAVGRFLSDGLVVQDDPADELVRTAGAKEKLAVRTAVRLGIFDADRFETSLDRARALVGGEDPLAGRHEITSDLS